MRYRKKPVVIEAFQMTRERRSDNREWPEWLNRAWNMDFRGVGAVSCADYPDSDGKTDQLVIRTLEGVMYVGWNDFIIQGVKGELYACKPDIFAATYEPADAVEPVAWASFKNGEIFRVGLTKGALGIDTPLFTRAAAEGDA